MRKLALVAVAIAGVCWLRSERPAPTAAHDAQRARRVVTDIAAIDGGGIRWHASAMRNEAGTEHAVVIYNDQSHPANVSGVSTKAWVETPTWTLALDLARVTEMVCVVRFIPPRTLLRSIELLKGSPGGRSSEMITILFDEQRAADFERVCAKHGLRRDDDRVR